MHNLPTVQSTMDTREHTLRPDMDITEGIAFLLENRITGAPVVDAEGKLLGLLSERECLKLVAEGRGGEEARGTVGDFMSTDFRTVTAEMDIFYVAGKFLRDENHVFRRFLVVEHDRLLGVITRYDILRAVQTARGQTT